jgi:hypothetical protein
MRQEAEGSKRNRALIWAIVVAIVLVALMMFSSKKLAAEESVLDRCAGACRANAIGAS